MMPLKVTTGDAMSPNVPGPKIIAHICNDVGGWGKGFVLAVSQRWPEPERD
ncbi:MAG: Appr-1-p processing protein, partial [Candidatus Dormibacteraceae bacterium]